MADKAAREGLPVPEGGDDYPRQARGTGNAGKIGILYLCLTVSAFVFSTIKLGAVRRDAWLRNNKFSHSDSLGMQK